jgi:GAF domain-containing protein
MGLQSAFMGDDVSLLELVADRAGLALENVRLYEEMEEIEDINPG